MLGITDLKTGTAIDLEGDPYVVLSYQHSKLGRGGAILRTKLRNLRSNAVVEMTFKGGDKFEEATLQKKSCSYLYSDSDGYAFMDSATFEQFSLSQDEVGDKSRFLKEGGEVQILFYEDKPVSIDLPIKMEFEVTHTEPGVRGDTAQGGTKPATLETGAVITVPLFVKIGDIIRVNTVEGSYVERAGKK
ncbi:elongation factor P [Patescibacteria group bacterium]|nr:elongation factor P [Patescibacteria group bacterium]